MRKIFPVILLLLIFASCRDVSENYRNIRQKSREPHRQKSIASLEYTGDSLRHIAVPVGGIGTGNLLVGGRGNILEMEIFGRPNRDELPPYMTFFAVHSETAAGKKDSRIAEARYPDDFPNPFGVPRQQLSGIPRFSRASFRNEFPLSYVSLDDDSSPLSLELCVYNPFIPLDTESSSLPMAAFIWQLKNKTKDSLSTAFSFSMGNPFNTYNNEPELEGTVEHFSRHGSKGIMFKRKIPGEGSILMLTKSEDVNINSRWYRGNWWDNAEVFWKDFSDDGLLKENRENYVFTEKVHDVATLNVPLVIPPEGEVTIPFYVFWDIPGRKIENSMALGSGMDPETRIENYYSLPFTDAADVAGHYFSAGEYLDSMTFQYHDILFSSTYPYAVVDALASNTAGLKTNLMLRTGKGNVHAFEGLGNDFGCCPGNCTHVWNYAQSLAYLFPELERNMREVSFLHDTHPNGYQNFRTIIPQGDYYFKNVAADGQMGNIMRVYREWKLSGNNEWLSRLWPMVKRSLEFAWNGGSGSAKSPEWASLEVPWDPGKEGVIRGRQHNTYDIDFFGPNMFTGSLYLGALKAAAEMARVMGDSMSSSEYLQLYRKGRDKYEQLLWNGEYYIQIPEVAEGVTIPPRLRMPSRDGEEQMPKYQFGRGCLSDQLLGQFLADMSGLGMIMDSSHTARALRSVYRYNFIPDFSGTENVQRVYALNNEGGLVICSWPQGEKPLIPFVYSNEVWTGIEYQVASTLISHGMTEEGIKIAQAVRNRYRGYNRNPLAEIESGRYYARALSSWGLLISLSGYRYDGTSHHLSFAPAVHKDDFFTFWSTGNAWGYFSIKQKAVHLKVEYGRLKLKHFAFTHPSSNRIIETIPKASGTGSENGKFNVSFTDTLIMNKGDLLTIVTE